MGNRPVRYPYYPLETSNNLLPFKLLKQIKGANCCSMRYTEVTLFFQLLQANSAKILRSRGHTNKYFRYAWQKLINTSQHCYARCITTHYFLFTAGKANCPSQNLLQYWRPQLSRETCASKTYRSSGLPKSTLRAFSTVNLRSDLYQ
jgi:hypothetical protein